MRTARTRVTTHAALILGAVVLALLAGATVSGCRTTREPITVSKQVLGTVVTITAYGDDEAAVRRGAEAAFAEMTKVQQEIDPYADSSRIREINDDDTGRWHDLPPSAVEMLDRVDRLAVRQYFSPVLFGVTKLYDFGGAESVPATVTLENALMLTRLFERDGDRARFFSPISLRLFHGPGEQPPPPAGLDFGGAAKGLALDRALVKLRAVPGIRGAMISTVSSTVVWGAKPDGEPWRVGVEDPRETGRVVAVVSAEGTDTLNISTSGDYQTYFERDGVRYHHILDPTTGRPARGMRSLTVFGRISGMDADILSTALFVMGRDLALEYAKEHQIGVYLVDETGRAAQWVPKDVTGAKLEMQYEPKP